MRRCRCRRGGGYLCHGIRHGNSPGEWGSVGAQLAKSPSIDQIMPKFKIGRKASNPLVAALVYDGLCAFEFSCAAEVFGLSRPEFGPDWYRFETCSLKGRSVRSQYGLQMQAQNGLER